ncbi:MAG: CTP synthetase [Maritimibacter sp.]
MTRLILFLGTMIGSTLAFAFVVAALVFGVTGVWPLLGAALAGYDMAWPIAYEIGKHIR